MTWIHLACGIGLTHCQEFMKTMQRWIGLVKNAQAMKRQTYIFIYMPAPCGLRGCKNGPTPFPGRMSYKATKPGLVFVLYLSMFLPARRRPQGLVVIGVCLSVCLSVRTASVQVCVPLGHSSLFIFIVLVFIRAPFYQVDFQKST